MKNNSVEKWNIIIILFSPGGGSQNIVAPEQHVIINDRSGGGSKEVRPQQKVKNIFLVLIQCFFIKKYGPNRK